MLLKRKIEDSKNFEDKNLPRSQPSIHLTEELIEALKKQIQREERRKELEREERARFYFD